MNVHHAKKGNIVVVQDVQAPVLMNAQVHHAQRQLLALITVLIFPVVVTVQILASGGLVVRLEQIYVLCVWATPTEDIIVLVSLVAHRMKGQVQNKQ